MPAYPTLLSFTKVNSLSSTLTWRLTFSEPVTGVRLQDFLLAGDGTYSSGASIADLVPEGDGTSWLLSVTPGPGEGQVYPRFDPSAVRDVDGNAIAGTYSELKSQPYSDPGQLIVLDTDGDGVLDIVTGNGVRLGAGDGSFGAQQGLTGGQSAGVPIALDGNGDGRTDLVVAGSSGASFLAGRAGGGFFAGVAIDLGGAAQSLIAADVNGDGRADVLVVPSTGAVRVALQQPGGSFAPAVATVVPTTANVNRSIAAGDLNGDGRADMVSLEGELTRTWLAQADGSFSAGVSLPTGLNRSGVWLSDFNGDGKLDLLTQGMSISVRLGDGLGGFGERLESVSRIPDFYSNYPYTSARAMPVQVIRDVTGDGIADLIGVSSNTSFSRFGTFYVDEAFITPGLGNGRFGTPISQSNNSTGIGQFLAYEDFDNDGRDDFLTVKLPNSSSSAASLNTSLQVLYTIYTEPAKNYTPPQLLSITASTPDAVLRAGDEVILTLHFDRAISSNYGSFLRLNNGGTANPSGSNGTTDLQYRYRAMEGEAIDNLEVQSIVGRFNHGPSGLIADVSHPPIIPGSLEVVARTPLYFANTDGRLAVWTFDGFSVFDKVFLSQSAGHGAAAIIHENGYDSLFYTSGRLSYISSTTPPTTGVQIGSVDAKWTFVGEGGSSGTAERVFWHSDQGELVFWDTGSAGSPRGWLGQATLDWRVAAIADTTGDGAADVLFQNQDGQVALWQVEGNAVTRSAVIDVVTPDWRLAAAGDLNGDGMADLLYRNDADDRLVARFLDGFNGIGDNQVIGTASNDWAIADLRDMNGDGREDILWRNTSGDFAVWTMDGAQIQSQQVIDKISSDWVLLT